MRLEAEFGPGPMGLALATNNTLVQVHKEGQAERRALQVGDTLVAVNDVDVESKGHDEVLQLIKGSPRPMTLVFLRKEGEAEGGEGGAVAAPQTTTTEGAPPTIIASMPGKLFAAAKPANAAAAVTKAGNLMKGLFGASVQMIGAFDRALDRAVEDGSRQAKTAARQARISTATITRQRGLGSTGGVKLGEGGLSLNLSGLMMSRDSSFSSAPHPDDELFVATAGWAAARAGTLARVKQGSVAVQSRMDIVDGAVSAAREQALTFQADAQALAKALGTHVAAIAADAAATANVAAELQAVLVALESRMFTLLLIKASGEAMAWEAGERKLLEQYGAARRQQIIAAQADGTGKTARQLLAAEEGAAASTPGGGEGEEGGGPRGKLPIPADMPAYNSGQVAAIAAAINSSLRRNVDVAFASNRAALSTFVGELGAAGGRAFASMGKGGAQGGGQHAASGGAGEGARLAETPQARGAQLGGSSPPLSSPPTPAAVLAVTADTPYVKVKDVANRFEGVAGKGAKDAPPPSVAGGAGASEDIPSPTTGGDASAGAPAGDVSGGGAPGKPGAAAGKAGGAGAAPAAAKKVSGRIAALASNYGKPGAVAKKEKAAATGSASATSSSAEASGLAGAAEGGSAEGGSAEGGAPPLAEEEAVSAADATPAAAPLAPEAPLAEVQEEAVSAASTSPRAEAPAAEGSTSGSSAEEAAALVEGEGEARGEGTAASGEAAADGEDAAKVSKKSKKDKKNKKGGA